MLLRTFRASLISRLPLDMKQGASIQSQNVKANRKLEKTAHPRYSGSCGDYLDSRSEKTVVREKSWR